MNKIISTIGALLAATVAILSFMLGSSRKKLKESEEKRQTVEKSVKKYEKYKQNTQSIDDSDRSAIIDELRKRGEYKP